MIAEASPFSTATSTTFEVNDFDLKADNMAHIIDIVENRLYSNKALAVIREYSTNALDANVMAGRGDKRVRITLPSRVEAKFKVRDFGYGLTKDEMVNVFCSYGESTKRNTNSAVGQMGIGCKAGFSYGSSFLVTSYQKGVKTVYNCVKNSPRNNLVTVGVFDTTEADGLEISINVRDNDIDTFRDESFDFFKFWEVMPEIIGFGEEELVKMKDSLNVYLSGNGWKLLKESSGKARKINTSYALMGNIAYPIDWNNVNGFKEFLKKVTNNNNTHYLSHFITVNSFVFEFGIGEVKMSPSREGLEYIEKTDTAILNKLQVVLNEINASCQAKIDSVSNVWDAKVIWNDLFEGYQSSLYYLKDSIKLVYNGSELTHGRIVFGDAYKHIAKCYIRKKTIFSVYNSFNSVECNDKTALLELDVTEGIFVGKAATYLHTTHGYTKIIVLSFKDSAERNEVFAAIGLNDSFIIKYSSISNIVKKTIVRKGNTATGNNGMVDKDSTIRSLKYVTGSIHYRNNVNNLDSEYTDMVAGGVYVEIDKTAVKSNYYLHDIADMVNKFNAINTDTPIKVYFIGQGLIDSKLMRKGNWVKFDDYIKTYITDFVNTNNLGLIAAFHTISSNVNVSLPLAKFFKKHKFNSDLNRLADFVDNKYKNIEREIAKNYKPTQAELDTVKDLLSRIWVKYPLISLLTIAFDFNRADIDNVEAMNYFSNAS